MVTKTLDLAQAPAEDFRKLPDGREILSYHARDVNGNIFSGPYYKGVWLVDQLGKPYFYPTSADLDTAVDKAGIVLDYDGTRTLVLLPDSKGRLTERARRANNHGGRLTGYQFPMVSEDFKVHGYEQVDELDHLEINPDTLRPYPELDKATRMLNDQVGNLYIQGWNRGLPVAFGKQPNPNFKNTRIWLNPDYNFEFGERPLRRGSWVLGPHEYMDRGRRFDTGLNRYPSDSDWRFRLGRAEEFVRISRQALESFRAYLERNVIGDTEAQELLQTLKVQ